MRQCQQHEAQAVGPVRAVHHRLHALVPVDLPGVATRDRIAVHVQQKPKSMPCDVQPLRIAIQACGHRKVDDQARAAHQVTLGLVEDRAVVQEVLEVAAGRVQAAPVVELEDVEDVQAQEAARAEVWRGGRRAAAAHGGSSGAISPH